MSGCIITVNMSDRQKEREDLARADFDVAEGEKRVSEQIILIQQLTERGEERVEAESCSTTSKRP